MCCTILIGTIVLALTAASSFLFDFRISNYYTLVGGSSLPFLIYYLIKTYFYYRKLPPGPRGWPTIGRLIELNIENSLLKCQEYAKKYGNLFCMQVGQYMVVVINDLKLIQEALKKEELQGRPDFQPWNTCNVDRPWQDQRLLAASALSDISGRSDLERILTLEARELVNELKTSSGQSVDLKKNVNKSVFNSLWHILSGQRFELNDPEFVEVVSSLSSQNENQGIFTMGHYFPWFAVLNYLPGMILPAPLLKSLKTFKRMFGFFDRWILPRFGNYKGDEPTGYIDGYLYNQLQSMQDSSYASEDETKKLQVALVNLFQAGSETTATTLLWAIFFLSKFPEVQQKLHDEIQQIVGSGRLPSRADRAKMPYLEAFMNEVHRKASVVPLTAFHKATKDCKFGGYSIYKDFIVLPNLYAVHHDEDHWHEPQKFRPERFLDPTGTKLVYNEALMPFGNGKRMCLGEAVVRDTLFFFLTSLLQNFSFSLDPRSENVAIDIPTPKFINFPIDFKVIMSNRRVNY
ncbi:unnamed protein product [Allacma fusca]|uniref:Cytochrome P450 n=1 Tax=Allacma fusca TaxID=39272 RepID=A0A8J2PU42_9HEXA|nr:unnamed protein product [Allacma fusca]